MNPEPPRTPILHIPGLGTIQGSLIELPWLFPGLVATFIVACVAARRLGRWLGAHPVLAFFLILSAGTILSATLTPLGRTGEHPGACSLERLTLASLDDIRWESDIRENIVLFIPLGLALGLLPRSASQVRPHRCGGRPSLRHRDHPAPRRTAGSRL